MNLQRRRFGSAAGAGWTNPAASLVDDTQAATAAGGAGWLALTAADVGFNSSYAYGSAIDTVTLTLKGSTSATGEGDRMIEACLTIDGVTCHSNMRTALLGSIQTAVTLGTQKRIDTWGRPLWQHDVAANKNFGVMIRLRGNGPVAIQYAEISVTLSEMPGMLDAGNFRACSPLMSNGGYHCSFPGANGSGANFLYWIQPQTGEVRWLGNIVATNWGGSNKLCLSTNALWDSRNANVYYCVATLNNQTVLLKGTYTGNDVTAAPGTTAQFQWQNLTPGDFTISSLMRAVDPSFDSSLFTCRLGNISGDYVVIGCYRAGQDSYAWIAVFNLGNRLPLGAGGTGQIAAVNKSFAAPATRWCGLHSFEPLNGVKWVGWTPKTLKGNQEGLGPFVVKLQTSLPASQGRMTVRVSGEPQPSLMPAAVGDTFQVVNNAGYDTLQIVEKRSPTEWVVERRVIRAQPTSTVGEREMIALCAASMPDPSVAGAVYWSFTEDPRSLDLTNTKTVVEKVLTGSHIVQRGDYRLQQNWSDGYQIVTPGAPVSWNKPVTYRIASNPKVDGVRAYIGLPEPYQGMEAYQSHPSYENYLAPAPRNGWFVDLIPFIGLPRLTNQLSLVPGFHQVYRPALKVNLHRSTFPTYAKCGGRMLRETAGPITDADAFSFCVGAKCASGAASDDVFINCPAPVTASSNCSQAFFGDEASVCVSDLAPFGQSVSQFFFDPLGPKARVLTNGLMPVHSPRTPMILDTASPLPDGSWVVFPSFANNTRKDLYMVKVPSDPAVATAFQSTAVMLEVRPPAGLDVAQVAVEYGDSRMALVSNALPCLAGSVCNINIPAANGDVLYTRMVYRNASGAIIGTGKVEVVLTGGMKGAGQKIKVSNAASQGSEVAPGGVASVESNELENCELAAVPGSPAPRELCGVSVLVNGEKAALFQVGPAGIKFQVPVTTVPGQELVVSVGSAEATVAGSDVLDAAPALYSYTEDGQIARAIVWSGDSGRLRAGGTAVVYANSLGPTDPEVPDGQAAPVEPLAVLTREAEVYINGVRQKVLYAGLAPGQVGIYQVNFQIDAATPVLPENQNRIWLRVGEKESARLVIQLDSASIVVER